MKRISWRSGALALYILLGGSGLLRADSGPVRMTAFGVLEPVNPAEVRAQASLWFNKYVGDPLKRGRLEAIWNSPDRPLFDRVTDTLALDPTAARLLEEARNPLAPAPQGPPALFADVQLPLFYRANLALAYGKALALRRIYEEALATFQLIHPEDVADPAAYFFHRGVCEYSLLHKDNARRSLHRLLDEVPEVPERYKTVATLMLLDMVGWRDKDLNWIARKMDSSGRRLRLARGGPATQKIQRDIVHRLDEMIKELENRQKGYGSCPSGGPDGGAPAGSQGGNPMPDSQIAGNPGTGAVQARRIQQFARRWGAMPEKERRQVLQDLTRGMSDKHAQAIQEYFRRLADHQRMKSTK